MFETTRAGGQVTMTCAYIARGSKSKNVEEKLIESRALPRTERNVNRLSSKVGSYLAFDVYFLKGSSPESLEMGCSFPNFHAELIAVFGFDYVLCTMRFEEITTCLIVIETKFISEKAQCYMGISSGNIGKSAQALAFDEHVHQVAAHVLCLKIESEELVVVAKRQ